MTRKIMSLVLTLAMVLGAVGHAAFFTDLQAGSYDWAKETINKLADCGIIKGYSDGTYGPQKEITRQEAFTLFARAAGVNDAENAYGVEFNQYVYKNVSDKYNTYAKKELCFMLERGILTEEEIGEYLSDENKNKIMLRHEAAVLISKILDIRDGFDENGEYLLNYTDVNDIADTSMAAVGFAAAEGIMTGMADGSFSANTGVTRAQVAIMLDRVINKLAISYKTGTVTAVSEFYDNVLEIDSQEYVFDEKTMYAINGKACGCKDIKAGDSVTVVYVNSGAWAVEVVRPGELVFEKVRGIVEEISASSLTLKDGTEYNVSAFLTCYENGELKKYDEMNYTNPVKLEIVNGFVRRINGTGEIAVYENAQILSIATIPSRKLKISADGVEKEYEIASDAVITRNGYAVDLKNLSIGEIAYVLIENEIIKKIGVYTDFDGSVAAIKQIVIDETESSVLLNIASGERFKIEKETVFKGEDNSVLTIYDLRLGDTVTAKFEEGKLAELKYGKYIPPTSFGGLIKNIDKENNVITIKAGDEERIVKITSATSMIKYLEAEKITIDDLAVEGYVVVAGEFIGEEFVATSIVF